MVRPILVFQPCEGHVIYKVVRTQFLRVVITIEEQGKLSHDTGLN